MYCPYCNAEKDHLKVIDSRTCEGGRAVRRRRQCLKCDKRFTTYERVEEAPRLTVVKHDGRRMPWDRNKILSGLERACFKRPVPQSELQQIVDEVEEEVHRTHDREVPSQAIGQAVTERLRKLDQVAYVRFASVYRKFATLEELIDEANNVIASRRYETPGQGRLFGDDPKSSALTHVSAEDAPSNVTLPAATGGETPKARAKPAKVKKSANNSQD